MQKFFKSVQDKVQETVQSLNAPAAAGPYTTPAGSPFAGHVPAAHFPKHHSGELDFGPRVTYPQPGQRTGPGKLPPKVKETKFHPAMDFYHPRGHRHETQRDIGHSGVVDGRIIWNFGDTLMGPKNGCFICATDSVAIGHRDHPMKSVDVALWPNSDRVMEWIPANAAEEATGGLSNWSFGGSNIVETGTPGRALCFYLKMHRPHGKQRIVGAGVATVAFNPAGVLEATRNGDHMWESDEPCWGDVGIAYNAADGYLYALGKGPEFDRELWTRTFLCRVPAAKALDVAAYEYWDNSTRTWDRTRFTKSGRPGTRRLENKHCLFDWMSFNQAYPFWSNYFNCWMCLYGMQWGTSGVFCKTADKIEGPWQDHGEVATTRLIPDDPALRYAHTGHPEFDESGKTVLVTWTRDNEIYGVTIEWQ